ncbi:hypothetical protein [Algibacter sp. PT7-4]|uniref:hypothetical protein n=1 Tax=Algibacter ulvanivorans TaxID=3400999 RepID=UPI003AAF1C0B
MTILYTEHFKLDLTPLNIKFSEENSFFEKDLIKQQSFPFKIPRTRHFIPFLEFVSSHNSASETPLLEAKLFRNGSYYEAELLILGQLKDLNAIIYFSFDKLTIFNTPIQDLPWPNIEIETNMFDFANQTKSKSYPETPVNFVQVYDPEKYKDYEYGEYKNPYTTTSENENGNFINHCRNGEFTEHEKNKYAITITKMNELRPFAYILEIVKFIFMQIGYTVIGDLVTSPSLQKALQYHDNQIFFTNKDFLIKQNFNFELAETNVVDNPGPLIYNEYLQQIDLEGKSASYTVSLKISSLLSENDPCQCRISCFFNDKLLASKLATNYATDAELEFSIELNFNLEIPEDFKTLPLEFKLECPSQVIYFLEGEFEIKGTKRPLYYNSINIKNLLPNQTVGEYISNIKSTFIMTSTFNPLAKTVSFDFFNNFINTQPIIDLTSYQASIPFRKLNKLTGYKIDFSNNETLFLNKNGEFVNSAIGYTSTSIPLEPLPAFFILTKGYVKHQEGTSILFYKTNENALPLVTDDDVSYTRYGFVHHFLRNWLYQNLNAEEYNVTLNIPLYKALKIKPESKLKLYNNNFSIHNLKRQDKGALFESIQFRLFKVKNTVSFNFGITTPDFEPPVIITATRSIDNALPAPHYLYTETTNFIVDIVDYKRYGENPVFIKCSIFTNLSYDPQDLDFYFSAKLISAPTLDLTADIYPSITDKNIITFQKSIGSENPYGNYIVRLTATNSVGLSSSIDLTLTVV